jgi:predicted regulator of Ras-like GTPase activity (Roadblock/LC7/MglB family)
MDGRQDRQQFHPADKHGSIIQFHHHRSWSAGGDVSVPPNAAIHINREKNMSNINVIVDTLLKIDGALAAAVVDSNSGMVLGSGGTGVDLELAAAGNTEVVRAKMKTIKSLGLNDVIEDILITLGKQYHILRPIEKYEGLFIYVVLDKNKSNLALARRKVLEVEQALEI